MRTSLISLLLLGSAPNLAAAQSSTSSAAVPGWPLEIGASVFTRFELREGYDRLGVSRGRFQEGSQTVYRTRLVIDSAPIDIGGGQSVRLRFAPQVDGAWGNQPSTISNPNLGINEAYLRLSNDLLTFDAGHFMMNYGDALVIGNLDWHQTARTFDGARVRVSPKGAKHWVDVFVTQLSDGWGSADVDAFAGDALFSGVYADLGPLLSPTTTLEPYALAQIWFAQDDLDGAAQGTLGVRALQRLGVVDLRVEAGLQVGDRRAGTATADVLAYQVDAEVGVRPLAGLRLALQGLYASGDDPDTARAEGWDQLFPTAHKFLGLMDVIGGRSNVASGVAHLSYAGLERVVVKLDGHVFFRPQTPDGVEAYAGTELNLNVVYKIGRGLSLRAMYAVFLPGGQHFIVGGAPADEPAHYVETQLGWGF